MNVAPALPPGAQPQRNSVDALNQNRATGLFALLFVQRAGVLCAENETFKRKRLKLLCEFFIYTLTNNRPSRKLRGVAHVKSLCQPLVPSADTDEPLEAGAGKRLPPSVLAHPALGAICYCVAVWRLGKTSVARSLSNCGRRTDAVLDSPNNSTTLLDEVACIKDPDGFPMPDGCYYSEDIPTLLACSLVHFCRCDAECGSGRHRSNHDSQAVGAMSLHDEQQQGAKG